MGAGAQPLGEEMRAEWKQHLTSGYGAADSFWHDWQAASSSPLADHLPH